MQKPLTLFCLPCAGASATMYLRWRRLLPSWITVEPIELPGRGSRMDELPTESYAALTQSLCDELVPTLPERYVLFGHSMGALLAYGVAQGLCTRRSSMPIALLVSGCAAPSRQDSQRYHNMQSDAALIADLSRQGGTPEEVFGNQELLRMTLDLLRVDYRVCGSFEYAQLPPLPIPIHSFGGRADEISATRLNDWRLESTQAFTLDWFDGGHFFLRQSEDWFMFVLKKRLMESRIEVLSATLASA
ncbi:surfactin synthase thioesterase subunit [Nitrosomonas sp. Nm84]|uniref:thioesterase II family protein n=1 Tax=Nitrosomonas sp. Nm84 TaxID=200124 RepID=UPI000D769F13|nr:alpha/beta fold hydrolase [Nitrosomonas sp. Nm84]PXW81731.1 surfactin synthase thioesterase subunit [Nitrosomonas sp. Nm84]